MEIFPPPPAFDPTHLQALLAALKDAHSKLESDGGDNVDGQETYELILDDVNRYLDGAFYSFLFLSLYLSLPILLFSSFSTLIKQAIFLSFSKNQPT